MRITLFSCSASTLAREISTGRSITTQLEAILVRVRRDDKLAGRDMHSDVSEIDFRQNHFDKYIFTFLALVVEPIVEIVAVNRAALDEVLMRTQGDLLPHILKQRRDRVASVQANR